jgi:hypothetical protein
MPISTDSSLGPGPGFLRRSAGSAIASDERPYRVGEEERAEPQEYGGAAVGHRRCNGVDPPARGDQRRRKAGDSQADPGEKPD